MSVVQSEDYQYYLYKNKTYTNSLLLTISNTFTNRLLNFNPSYENQTDSVGYTYRLSFYLKNNVKMKSGKGTKCDPYVLTLE